MWYGDLRLSLSELLPRLRLCLRARSRSLSLSVEEPLSLAFSTSPSSCSFLLVSLAGLRGDEEEEADRSVDDVLRLVL